jgi:Cys-tRNA(Pro)/Cys-tRNA(Cys) deacylase
VTFYVSYPTFMKTRAAQILDTLSIRYEIREFKEEMLTAEEAAEKLAIPLAQVFKTLVVRGDQTGIIEVCVPGTRELNLKALARITGDKKTELVEVNEVFKLTGYLRGGCSPLGAKKKYPVYIDESALECPFISISAGMRGMQIVIDPKDLIRAAGATVGEFTSIIER